MPGLEAGHQKGQHGIQGCQILGSFLPASCSFCWLAQGPLPQGLQQQEQRKVGEEPVPLPCIRRGGLSKWCMAIQALVLVLHYASGLQFTV